MNDMRLIDADALLEKVQFRLPGKSQYAEVIARCVEITRQLIVDSPTIDAVPVVRCKDCKYRSGLVGRPPFMFYICTCAEGLTGAVRDENYCSYGERKDGEG